MRLLPAALLVLLGAAPAQEASLADRLLDAVERRHRATPDPTDVCEVVVRLGFNRARILEFMSGLTWEPYPGILRDVGGTLMCGGGNSIDRALLLQSLLEVAGERTRLVRVDLAEADGLKLVETFRKRERKDRPEVDPKRIAADLGVEAPAVEAMVTERRRAESALVEEILETAKGEAARLAPLVGPIAGRETEVPREHVWVQVQEKSGWVDLDPSPVEVPRKGFRPMTAQEIAAQRRTVTIRLVLNRKSGGKVEPVALLTVPSPLGAVAWKAVDLLMLPLPGQLPAAAKLAEMDDKGRLEAFRKAKTFRGGLIVDGKYYGGVPFDLSGKTYDVDAGGRVGGAKALGGGVGKVFGGAFGGDAEEAPASALESVVLEVAVKGPGAPERVHRRVLIGAAAPGALPILRTSFLVDGAPLPAGERGRRELAVHARNAPALRRLLKGERAGVHFNQHVEVPSLLLRFADLRRRALLRLAEGKPFLQDRPGLCSETSQVFIDEKAGRLLHRRGIDILDNPARFETGDRTLTLGVAETVLECLLLTRGWPGESNRSAWTRIERARLQGGKGEALDLDGGRAVRWSPEAWWSVDPSSGVCVGRVPSGAGQGMVEAAWENASAVCTYSDVIGFAAGLGSSAKVTPQAADDAASLYGKACGVAGGTWARDVVADKINEITQGLWTGTIAALSGM